jgi:hypothetical protein
LKKPAAELFSVASSEPEVIEELKEKDILDESV